MKMLAYLFKDAQGRVFSRHPWLAKWREGVRIGGVGDITLGSSFCRTLRTEPLVVEGGSFLGLISRTAPSPLIAGSQRQPEVKGEWMGEQHPRREKGRMERWKKKRQCLYRLGYIKWQLLSSSVHNWVEILLVRWDECRLCPTAYCWWWNIEICITSLFATAAGAILKASLRRDGMLKDPVVWVSVSSLKFLQICHVSCY